MGQFRFCPLCGTQIQNGRCPACGYAVPVTSVNSNYKPIPPQFEKQYEQPQTGSYLGYQPMQNQKVEQQPGYYMNRTPIVQTPPKRSSNKVWIPIVISVAVVLTCLVAIVGVNFGLKRWTGTTSGSSYNYGVTSNSNSIDFSFSGLGDYDGTLKEFLDSSPDLFYNNDFTEFSVDDPYDGTDLEAYEFDTYVDTSVGYDLYLGSWTYYNQHGEYNNNGASYPECLTMFAEMAQVKNTGLANEDQINKLIYEETTKIANMAEDGIRRYVSSDYGYYAQCDMYVAYMSDEVLSLLFNVNGYITYDYDDDTVDQYRVSSTLGCINIDMTTGEKINASERFEFGYGFYEYFLERCEIQNGDTTSAPSYYSDSKYEEKFLSDDDVIWAYTPIGLEVGMNAPYYEGWSTITITDYSAYEKVY